MNSKKLNEGFTYVIIGIVFFLLTFDFIFPFIMHVMKGIFYITTAVTIFGGSVTIFESLNKKDKDV